ncbi:hypothetical protein N44_00437 [Microcystis aeruginosa NIES-44]|uniref:Uncharacterized protein n=1 Tax=Microcystis aeruginosa NIES-44 TaxID=449439 RepID=A0A0A1VRA0_MICAE|nr:hypothetical protein N44_00437 [Microcystis aeruginosa NIES-44]
MIDYDDNLLRRQILIILLSIELKKIFSQSLTTYVKLIVAVARN